MEKGVFKPVKPWIPRVFVPGSAIDSTASSIFFRMAVAMTGRDFGPWSGRASGSKSCQRPTVRRGRVRGWLSCPCWLSLGPRWAFYLSGVAGIEADVAQGIPSGSYGLTDILAQRMAIKRCLLPDVRWVGGVLPRASRACGGHSRRNFRAGKMFGAFCWSCLVFGQRYR